MSDYYSVEDYDELPLFSKVNSACAIEKHDPVDDEEYSRKKEEILEALRRHDISCIEIETRWHRGQAVIGDLRRRGHVIHTIRGSYHYEGLREDMVKAKQLKELYYQTAHWRNKAKQRKEFDGWKCVQCHSTESLETHHWRYELFNEDLLDLVTLCEQCHRDMHDKVKGSSVHFPAYITQEMAERIRSDGVDN